MTSKRGFFLDINVMYIALFSQDDYNYMCDGQNLHTYQCVLTSSCVLISPFPMHKHI